MRASSRMQPALEAAQSGLDACRRKNSSLQLELEAADFFKLDASQMSLLGSPVRSTAANGSAKMLANCCRLAGGEHCCCCPHQYSSQLESLGQTASRKVPPLEAQQACCASLCAAQAHKSPVAHSKRGRKSRQHRQICSPGSAQQSDTRHMGSSSTTTTNSLPSVSSSPSVSPSLICPHLSLDDILELRHSPSTSSPHTIGLCAKCRLDPPPNVHSPLSPIFKPFREAASQPAKSLVGGAKRLTRGYSDHQAPSRRAAKTRDDSLDYYLEPHELRRLQMSPTMRNSVEFIRKNSIESGRIIRVYKNGCPYDKPLRVCIMRSEFASLTHLLDHINGRQLIPCGARYLFHLDGQLVYSVHELKHASAYIVSGTRSFDFRASAVLKSQLDRERHQTQPHKRAHSTGDLPQVASGAARQRSENEAQAAARGAPAAAEPKQRAQRATQSVRQPAAAQRVVVGAHSEQQDGSGEGKSSTSEADSQDGKRTAPKQAAPKRLTRIGRAKSELSGLAGVQGGAKQKKMVTFVDTVRGSSPITSDELQSDNMKGSLSSVQLASEQEPVLRELSTSEVGIQVSESIDGFLIDLPLELPAHGDEAGTGERRPHAMAPTSSRSKASTGMPAGCARAAARPLGAPKTGAIKPRRQIITIAERQLSLDELSQLKDLDQGDHHSLASPQVTIKLEPAGERAASDDEETKSDIKLEPGASPPPTAEDAAGAHKLVSATEDVARDATDSHWQYPGGRDSSATPTERPVSQSDANGAVRARVTTPSPSLSSATGANGGEQPGDAKQRAHKNVGAARAGPKKAPKRALDVRGELCSGLYEPTRNFRLLWVNGFTINDQYPDNSFSVQQQLAVQRAQQQANDTSQQQVQLSSRASTPTGARFEQTGPAGQATSSGAVPQQASVQFKPSERFHNWVCHSRLHDELIYPAASLVVLWCRWTNEQRYYSKHTANVSALTLSTLDLDLAASAQLCDLAPRQTKALGAQVHLWSLSTLDTLCVLDDDQIALKRIFCLKLKNSKSTGCELSVCARDDKQLFLLTFSGGHISAGKKRDGTELQHDSAEQEQKTEPKMTSKRRNKSTLSASDQSVLACRLRASKPIRSNQTPLAMLPLVQLTIGNVEPADSSEKVGKKATTKGDQVQPLSPLITIGRKYFDAWAPERRQQKLCLLQCENRSAKLAELIGQVNCAARLSPDEFLLGDSSGNVCLLSVSLVSKTPKRALPAHSAELKYTADATSLVGPHLGQSGGAQRAAAITCLARISGSVFACADSHCTVRVYRIERSAVARQAAGVEHAPSEAPKTAELSCSLLKLLSLPPDLGFICSIVPLAGYSRQRRPVAEFYAVSTSNAILFGSLNLAAGEQAAGAETLSVVYEGHESAPSSLVADCAAADARQQHLHYFTCSLDCRICKWDGARLVWKSLLPSPCSALAVHPLGFVLAVGSTDGTVYVLDKTSGLLISYFPLTPVCINCLAYSRDGALLAAGCANGSIFILPVYERGLKYKKVSIFQSPHPVVSLQLSMDSRYILTSVTRGSWQELILWDLPNFRYMRDNVRLAADAIEWFDSICSGSEDVRAIWENANLASAAADSRRPAGAATGLLRRPLASLGAALAGSKSQQQQQQQPAPSFGSDDFVVNLSCHRLIKAPSGAAQHLSTLDKQSAEPSRDNLVVASDTRGFLRLFRYPCYDIQQGFFAIRISSLPVNCCRFVRSARADYFVSTSFDGAICLWALD